MSANVKEIKVCPICHKKYSGYPALSREDNKTPICSDCGVRQALSAIGIDHDQIEALIMRGHEKNLL